MEYFFITGSSRGLGKAIAEALLELGAHVTGLSRSSTISHPKYEHCVVDLSDLDSVKQFEFSVPEDATRVVLINNAGRIGEIKPVGSFEQQ